jgi:pSer/pThr/pTyr-binding forkhead associated (FHA) protein
MSTNPTPSLKIKVSNRGHELRTQRFSEDVIYIGRDPDSTIFLDNPGVSRRHAKIQRTSEGYHIFDLQSGNGTFVNEKKIAHVRLHSGDVVRISKFALELELVSHTPATPPEPPEPAEHEIDGGETVFLLPDEQQKVFEQAKQAERVSEQIRSEPAPEKESRSGRILLIFAAGTAFGLLLAWLLS